MRDQLKKIYCEANNAVTDAHLEALGQGKELSLAECEEIMIGSLLANGVTVQEWISVKDRLPQENERVLACYINPLRKDRPPRMMVGEGTSTQIVKGKVYLWCGGWRSITHWMPLPQPPKGE